MKLWNLQSGELLVTIFRGEDGEWVIWNSRRAIMWLAGADKMVGWQINRRG